MTYNVFGGTLNIAQLKSTVVFWHFVVASVRDA